MKSWGIRSILQNCSYSEQLVWVSAREGGLLLKQVPPYSTEHGGGENVVLQRIPKLGGENRAFKPPNGYSEQVPYGKICSRSLHCTPQFSARRYDRPSHGNFLADVGIGFRESEWLLAIRGV